MRNYSRIAALVAMLASASATVPRGSALDPLHRQIQPDVTAVQHPLQPVTLTVINKVGKPLQAIVVTEVGDPSMGNSQTVNDQFTTTIPMFSAGHVTFGHTANDLGSKIELSNDGPPAPTSETEIYVNISYVDGYSLPIVCRCGSKRTGCSKPLYKLGSCPAGQRDGPVCINSAGDNGPPDPFFAPCRDEAYVYANQGGSGTGMYCDTYQIECCVGHRCGSNKRDLGYESDIALAMAERRGLIPDDEYWE